MIDWHRIIRFQVFSEDADSVTGPTWARWLFFATATASYLTTAVAIIAIVAGNTEVQYFTWSVLIVAFALMSGAAWHLGLRGRAKNGILLGLAFSILLALCR